MRELKIDEAHMDRLDEVLAFVDGVLEKMDCPMKTQMQIDVAVEEVYVNIVHYAYAPGTGSAEIRVETQPDRVVAITFIDWGMRYDPLKKPDPDITLSVKERPIGGLGVYMVKKSMDKMDYNYENGANTLTIYKRI